MQNYEEFESKLDINNIVGDQMSLARLAYILLSKEQILLMRHQNDQAFVKADQKSGRNLKLTPMKPKYRKKSFEKINKYCVKSEIDKRLVLGMFQKSHSLNKWLQLSCSKVDDFGQADLT